jgi:hypothetical protein
MFADRNERIELKEDVLCELFSAVELLREES